MNVPKFKQVTVKLMYSLLISKRQTPKLSMAAIALNSLLGKYFTPVKGIPEVYSHNFAIVLFLLISYYFTPYDFAATKNIDSLNGLKLNYLGVSPA